MGVPKVSALKPELNPLNLYFSGSDWSVLLQAQLLCSYQPPTTCFITITTTITIITIFTTIITTFIIKNKRCFQLRSWVCSPLTSSRAGKLRKPAPRKCICPAFSILSMQQEHLPHPQLGLGISAVFYSQGKPSSCKQTCGSHSHLVPRTTTGGWGTSPTLPVCWDTVRNTKHQDQEELRKSHIQL